MKFITLVFALAAALPAALASLTINTPSNVDECEPTQLMWSGGSTPYYVTVYPAGQTTSTPLKSFPSTNDTSMTWNVDIETGTSITIGLKDGTGANAYTSIVTIGPGTSSSCVTSSVTESGSSGSSTATTGGASGSSGATSAAAAATGGSSGSATSTASASTSSHTNAAGRLGVSSALGVAGLMGLVGAALF